MNFILAPIIVTMLCFVIAYISTRDGGAKSVGDLSSVMNFVVYYFGALVSSLIAWLLWALLK